MRNVIIVVVCLGLGLAALPFFMYGPLSQTNVAAANKINKAEKKQEIAARAVFPDELAPLGGGEGVAKAAEWKRTVSPIIAVVNKWSGDLHRWHEHLKEERRSYSVENTELALVVDKQWKTRIGTAHFQGGAPPVHRYRYHVDVWLVEAKSGATVSKKRFFSHPRQVKNIEPWKLTALGEQVRWKQVRQWLEVVIDDHADGRAEKPPATRP